VLQVLCSFAHHIPCQIQEVLLWKTFQSIARRLDATPGASEWKGDTTESTIEANKWGTMSLLNQKVIDALMKSIAEDGSEVKVG
jgi:hypothetical protein